MDEPWQADTIQGVDADAPPKVMRANANTAANLNMRATVSRKTQLGVRVNPRFRRTLSRYPQWLWPLAARQALAMEVVAQSPQNH